MSQNNQTSYFIINILPFSNQTSELQWILTELFFQVGDLDTTPIPIKMSVRGCPIYFQMIGPQPDNQNQGPIIRSVYYRMLKMLQFTCKDCSLIFMIDRFGSHVSGGDTVSRSLRLINTSPYGEPIHHIKFKCTYIKFTKVHTSCRFLKPLRYPYGLGDLQLGGWR